MTAGPGRIWPAAWWVGGLFGTIAVADLGHNLTADAVLVVVLVVAGVLVLLDPRRHRATSLEPELRQITRRPVTSQARILELEDELLPAVFHREANCPRPCNCGGSDA